MGRKILGRYHVGEFLDGKSGHHYGPQLLPPLAGEVQVLSTGGLGFQGSHHPAVRGQLLLQLLQGIVAQAAARVERDMVQHPSKLIVEKVHQRVGEAELEVNPLL